jgi:DNA-binding MarR family transcriptional regulator/ribosomal protein S18 acetylase RimI-like enzyme
MFNLSIEQSILVELRKIIKKVNIFSQNLALLNGLTVPQLNLLNDLQQNGKMTIIEISEKSFISKKTITEILHILERKGLIKRERSIHDRRIIYFSTSDDGEEIINNSPRLLQEIFVEELQNLDEHKQMQMLENLQNISSMLKAKGIDASPILSPLSELEKDIKDNNVIHIVKRPVIKDSQMLIVRTLEELEKISELESFASFIYENMKPFNDTFEMTKQGIVDSLTGKPSNGGFIVIGKVGSNISGAVVMLATGMKNYIPEYCLLFAAVDKNYRNYCIGQQLIEEAVNFSTGDIYLHVEYDNRAKRLYERMGFENKYAEMRFVKYPNPHF